ESTPSSLVAGSGVRCEKAPAPLLFTARYAVCMVERSADACVGALLQIPCPFLHLGLISPRLPLHACKERVVPCYEFLHPLHEILEVSRGIIKRHDLRAEA